MKIYKAKDGWRWKIQAKNGEIVGASSEAFETKAGAKRNANIVFDYLIKWHTK